MVLGTSVKPTDQPVLRSEPLEKDTEFRDNDIIRISGFKACKTVSPPVPNSVFTETGRTVYADEASTSKYADQHSLKDTETLRTPLVNPQVLRNALQQEQMPLLPQFKPDEMSWKVLTQ